MYSDSLNVAGGSSPFESGFRVNRRSAFQRLFNTSRIMKSPLVSETFQNGSEQFHQIMFGPVTALLRSPKEHAKIYASQLAKQAKEIRQPLKLFLSGGIDSEAMAESFIDAGAEFEVVIGRYNKDMNWHDYQYAIEFCEAKKLKYTFVDIDVYKFLERGGALAYARELGCRSPQLAVHLKLLDSVEGFCVLAGSPVFPVFKNSGSQLASDLLSGNAELLNLYGAPNQTQAVLMRYFETRNRKGQGFFFQSSPELCMAFLKLDTSLNAIVDGVTSFDYKMKCDLYSEGQFKAVRKPKKYTGFEKYRQEYDRQLNTKNGTGFDQLFRKPLENINPLLPLVFSINLPAEITKVLADKLIRKNPVPAAQKNPPSATRRDAIWKAGSVLGSLALISFFPRVAFAASCSCCQGGSVTTNHGLQGAGTCMTICMKEGADGYSIGGGPCEYF